MPRRYVAPISAILLGAVCFAGCAHAPLNRPLTRGPSPFDYRPSPRDPLGRRDDLFVVVFFSGGGMRAAAFSYGVLQAMHETRIPVRGESRELLSQVDLISAVSGGSFTAAYYCLNGADTFNTFERKVLWRNIENKLIWRAFRPDNSIRLLSPYFGRSDLAAEYYDRHIFNHATFGDLAQRKGSPFLVVNATDLENGARFGFTQNYFDLIGSDISTYPVARAVAASCAVPLLLSPVTLKNYAKQSTLLTAKESDDALLERFRRLMSELQLYGREGHHSYLHVVDGGVSDNLGLRAVQEYVMLHGGLKPALTGFGANRVTKYVVIVVDASTQNNARSGTTEVVPSIFRVVSDSSSVLLGRESYETAQLFEQSLKLWQLEMQSQPGRQPLDVYNINLDFSNLGDAALTDYCNQVGTDLSLSRTDAEHVRDAGIAALNHSPEFKRLMRDLASKEGPTAPSESSSKEPVNEVPSKR